MAGDARVSLTGNLLAVGCMVTWAMGFPAAEALMARWDLLPIMTGRFVVALLLLCPLWVWLDGPAGRRGVPWGRALLIGAVGFGGGAWFTLLAQAYTDPVTVAIFASAVPLYAVIVDRIWGQARFTWGFFAGLVFALLGGLVATGGGSPGRFGLGALASVLAGFTFCWGTVMISRAMPGASALSRTTVSAIGALLPFVGLVAAGMATGMVRMPGTVPWLTDAGLIIVYGAFGFALSQLMWVAASSRLGLGLAALHLNLASFYAMLIMLALGGGWSWRQAAGAAIVAVGVVLAQVRTVWPAG